MLRLGRVGLQGCAHLRVSVISPLAGSLCSHLKHSIQLFLFWGVFVNVCVRAGYGVSGTLAYVRLEANRVNFIVDNLLCGI